MAKSEKLKTLQDIARSREHESSALTLDAEVIRDAVKIAAAIKTARRKKGWNQQELATAMGTTQPVVARLENPGEDRMPNLSTVLKAINALGIGVYLVKSLEDACQAMAEMVQSQQPKAWSEYQATHPGSRIAALVTQTLDGHVTLPLDIQVDWDNNAPLIKLPLDE